MRLKGRAVTYNREGLPAGFLAREPGEPRPGRARLRGGMILGTLVLLLALGALAAAGSALGRGEIHRGVAVGEVAVGGMSRPEAREALASHASEEMGEIPLEGPGDATISGAEIGFGLDAAETAGRAYAVGREGNAFERVRQRVGAALVGAEIEPAVHYEREALRSEVEALAGAGASRSGVRLEGSRVRLVQNPDGHRVDVGATVRSVERAIQSLGGEAELVGAGLDASEEERALERAGRAVGEPLVLAHGDGRWTLSAERVAASLRLSGGEVVLDRVALGEELEKALSALEHEPVEARMVSGESGSVEVEPSRQGTEVRTERLLDEIQAGIFEGRHRYEVPVATVEPELTTGEAEAARPNTMLGEFETGYRVYDEPARVRNLATASEAVDGVILAPGETFSFNAAAAPLARYEPSDVIVDGRLGTALGGGLCQVASTLYMAANYAGLEIVERHPHYAELPYIRPGFDATVWFGSLDLKFRNDTGSHLLLEERVDEESGEVVARIYGQPTGREVDMSSRKLSGSGETTRWRSTRTVVEDGRVVERGTLNTDTYQPLRPAAPAPTGRGA